MGFRYKTPENSDFLEFWQMIRDFAFLPENFDIR